MERVRERRKEAHLWKTSLAYFLSTHSCSCLVVLSWFHDRWCWGGQPPPHIASLQARTKSTNPLQALTHTQHPRPRPVQPYTSEDVGLIPLVVCEKSFFLSAHIPLLPHPPRRAWFLSRPRFLGPALGPMSFHPPLSLCLTRRHLHGHNLHSTLRCISSRGLAKVDKVGASSRGRATS